MSKASRKKTNSTGKFRRLSLTTIVIATVILAVAAVTVASRQKTKPKVAKNSQRTTAVADQKQNNFMTVKVGGQDVKVDPQTGQMQELTQEEAQRMAAGLKKMLNQSTEGLVQVQHPDGSVSMDLEGRFQNVALARVNKDGSVTEGCFDNPKAAAEFVGVKPELMQEKP